MKRSFINIQRLSLLSLRQFGKFQRSGCLTRTTYSAMKPITLHNTNYFSFGLQLQVKQSEVDAKSYYMQQIYTGCLSEYAYYIESEGEAIIIDPLRDVEPYLQLAQERGAKIKYVALTHFHADFVAGHHAIQKQTDAQIVMGPNANAAYVNKVMKDGEDLQLGKVKIRALHTPGHTLESTCFLLIDENGKKVSIFTGDTLFLGEVGRPDLAVKSDLTREELARLLYKSLMEKIMPLPDDVNIYPGHGAGSACGKNIQSGFTCTIGKQKQSNYALQQVDQEQFVTEVIDSMPRPPQYFFYNATLNKADDIKDIEEVLDKGEIPLKFEQIKEHLKKGAIIVDSRNSISDGFIPGSLNVPFGSTFATWVGQLIKHNDPLIILAEDGVVEPTILRLTRIGYDNIIGYVDGGIKEWKKNGGKIIKPNEVNPKDLLELNKNPDSFGLLDIRTENEQSRGMIKGAKALPIDQLESQITTLPKEQTINVYCGSGLRAKMAVTILGKYGYEKVNICKVGYADIVKETGVETFVPKA